MPRLDGELTTLEIAVRKGVDAYSAQAFRVGEWYMHEERGDGVFTLSHRSGIGVVFDVCWHVAMVALVRLQDMPPCPISDDEARARASAKDWPEETQAWLDGLRALRAWAKEADKYDGAPKAWAALEEAKP